MPHKPLPAPPSKWKPNTDLPVEHHNPMEPFATTVIWEDDGTMTVYDKTQGAQNNQTYVRKVFGLSTDEVRVVSPFVGGAFGSGLRPQYQLFLAVMAARELKRSVKVSLTRQQMFTFGHRPADSADDWRSAPRPTATSRPSYTRRSPKRHSSKITAKMSSIGRACSTSVTTSSLITQSRQLDVHTPIDMRAPGAAWGVYALECAMDELAYKLGVDPLELRLKTTPRGIKTKTNLFRVKNCANVTGKARKNSAGRNAIHSRGRCATAITSSGGAWRPACGKRCISPASAKAVLTADGTTRTSAAQPPTSAPERTRL